MMILKRSIIHDGNIAPDVYNLLKCLPDEYLHNLEYGKAHPLAIYNESLNRIIKAFSKVLDIYLKHNYFEEFEDDDFLELLDRQKELLHSIHSHFDDCYQIIKVTSPYPNIEGISKKDLKKLERSPYYWLNYFKNPGIKLFTRKTENYRVFIGNIVNKIKHEQARLRGITIKMDQQLYLGYFVEVVGVNKKYVSKLPDLDIHPFGTAFSFARDLFFHFYNLYEISYYLKESLELSFNKNYDSPLKYEKVKVSYPDFGNIAKKLSELDNYFFLDEYSKPHPIIIYEDREDNNKMITLKLDSPWYRPYIPNIVEVKWHYESDGITEHSVMPYIDYCFRYLPIKSLPKLL